MKLLAAHSFHTVAPSVICTVALALAAGGVGSAGAAEADEAAEPVLLADIPVITEVADTPADDEAGEPLVTTEADETEGTDETSEGEPETVPEESEPVIDEAGTASEPTGEEESFPEPEVPDVPVIVEPSSEPTGDDTDAYEEAESTDSADNNDTASGEPAAEPEDVTAEPEAEPEDAEEALAEEEADEEDPGIATLAAISDGWSQENGSWYHYTDGVKDTGWLVVGVTPGSSTSGELERYWLDSSGKMVTSQLISESEAGWWAYATDTGAVVRGKWTDPSTGYVYLANDDGKLESPGWLVTGTYSDNGEWQRYWIDSTTHACMPGYSTAGWNHYTTSDGWVLRGGATIDGTKWYADNDGLLTTGWVVTSEFTGYELERYWFVDGKVATSRLVGPSEGDDSGWYAWAKADGSILRTVWDNGAGRVYLADNDGRLLGGDSGGWVVTSEFSSDGQLQRYYIDPVDHAARSGAFTVTAAESSEVNGSFWGCAGVGYVLRGGTVTIDGTSYYANNEGQLVKCVYTTIDHPYIDQNAEGAILGCEGASLYMALRACGYISDMSFVEFMDTMPYSSNNNPFEGFCGSPWYYTPGIYNGILMPATAEWGARFGSVEDITGCSEYELVYRVLQGQPVVIWVTVNFQTPIIVDEWYGTVYNNGHTMTLVGYNPDTQELQVADPNSLGTYWVSWDTFFNAWLPQRGAVAVW